MPVAQSDALGHAKHLPDGATVKPDGLSEASITCCQPHSEAHMAVSPSEFRRRRILRLRSAGICRPAAVYLAELEAAGPLEQPITSLEALLRTPSWPGRRVYHVISRTCLRFDGHLWRIHRD